jgi:hypothetical protein
MFNEHPGMKEKNTKKRKIFIPGSEVQKNQSVFVRHGKSI